MDELCLYLRYHKEAVNLPGGKEMCSLFPAQSEQLDILILEFVVGEYLERDGTCSASFRPNGNTFSGKLFYTVNAGFLPGED